MSEIRQLTGLRGAAAVMVLAGHSGLTPAFPGLPNIGVAIFFALSSFLLTYLALGEIERTGTLDLWGFYIRRIFRVWPLYIAAVIVAACYYPPWLGVEWPWILTLTSNWSMALYGFFDHLPMQPGPVAILWSISVEEQFYVILPPVLLSLLTLPKRTFLLTMVAIIISGPVLQTLFWLSTLSIQPGVSVGGMYFATFSYIDTLAFGGVAGAIYFHREDNALCRNICATIKPWHAIAIIVACMNIWASSIWTPYSAVTVGTFFLISAVSAMLVLSLAVSPLSLSAHALSTKPMQLLGLISFSLYIWHIYAMNLEAEYLPGSYAVIFALAIALGAVSYFLIEWPSLWARRTLVSDRVPNLTKTWIANMSYVRQFTLVAILVVTLGSLMAVLMAISAGSATTQMIGRMD